MLVFILASREEGDPYNYIKRLASNFTKAQVDNNDKCKENILDELSIGAKVFYKNNGFMNEEPEELLNIADLNQVIYLSGIFYY